MSRKSPDILSTNNKRESKFPQNSRMLHTGSSQDSNSISQERKQVVVLINQAQEEVSEKLVSENSVVIQQQPKNSFLIDLGRDQNIKAMIDKLYAKEKKVVYAKRQDEFVLARDLIFNLSKSENVCPTKSKQQEVPKEKLLIGTKVKLH